MVGSGWWAHWSSVLAVFQPPSSQSTLTLRGVERSLGACAAENRSRYL